MSFELINSLGKERVPFIFICDYKAKKIEVIRLEDLKNADIEFKIERNFKVKPHIHTLHSLSVPFEEYKQKFDSIIEKIKSGETYILNLTQPSKIDTTLSLKEIFSLANADYKLRFKDEFVCFSPETFIKIHDNEIHTFPMKGTIDASFQNAKEKILADTKELAEHVMIVDLLRNDLSMVAKDVKVEKFRYITEIAAGEKNLLQVSSHVSGTLEENWNEGLGEILRELLPAGSITGAPKKSTVEIIEQVEGYERGYFSGVFGLYDGVSVDSAVMIRFIEKTTSGYVYKSGGGITLDSDANSEYQEYQDKVYLP
jgi:para-aminobenzoate synthetase component I